MFEIIYIGVSSNENFPLRVNIGTNPGPRSRFCAAMVKSRKYACNVHLDGRRTIFVKTN